ncbi:MAG: acetyltransferase [Afipia sp.]|nr:acetyltransferase [Afipia sp.]OJW64434.1 MAG: acetyltransferase [Afipia sp. 64-13]
MSGRLAIVGAGGHGRVVADSATELGWSVEFFDETRTGRVRDWDVVGKFANLLQRAQEFDGVIVALGDNRTRMDCLNRLRGVSAPLVTIIDPTARVSRRAMIGEGSFLAAGSIVNVAADIGAGCIINTGASVDHDCRIGEGVHLSPGVHLSGTVEIGACSWLGTGSSVRHNIRIGANVIAGVGSVIVKDVEDGCVVIGVPARPMEKP